MISRIFRYTNSPEAASVVLLRSYVSRLMVCLLLELSNRKGSGTRPKHNTGWVILVAIIAHVPLYVVVEAIMFVSNLLPDSRLNCLGVSSRWRRSYLSSFVLRFNLVSEHSTAIMGCNLVCRVSCVRHVTEMVFWYHFWLDLPLAPRTMGTWRNYTLGLLYWYYNVLLVCYLLPLGEMHRGA